MVKHLVAKVGTVQQKLADNHLPDMLVYTTGLFTVVLGTIFFIDAENFTDNPTFRYTFSSATPEIWGAAMGLTGLLMMFGFWQNGSSGRAPAFVLTLLFALLGISAGREPLANPDGPALLSASAVYTFVGIVCAICVLACSSQQGGPHGRAADHHLPH